MRVDMNDGRHALVLSNSACSWLTPPAPMQANQFGVPQFLHAGGLRECHKGSPYSFLRVSLDPLPCEVIFAMKLDAFQPAISYLGALIAASCLCALWTLYGAIYRLYFSPVAKFPGPRLAAVSFWYEFYWDVVKGGRYAWHITELHKRYGPIIRINPYEIHILDPDFFDEVYVHGSKAKSDKWYWPVC